MCDIPVIYVFANERYGAPFVAAVAAISRHRQIPMILIHSAKNLGPLGWLGIWLRRRRRALGGGQTSIRVKAVPDVNAEMFYTDIEPGSLGLIAGFNQIFRTATIARFGRLVNVHPSILPYYRGPVPSYWAIVRGERQTGFTIHDVTPNIDEGPVIAQGIVDIPPSANHEQLDTQIASAGAAVLADFVDCAIMGRPFAHNHINAHRVYEHPVDYLGHPRT